MEVRSGDFRWLTVAPPNQKEVELVLLEPRTVFDPPIAEKFEELMDQGKLGGCVLHTTDCRGDYERLKACDNSKNSFTLIQPR